METNQSTQIIFSEGSEPELCTMYIDMAIFSDKVRFNPSELTEKLGIQPKATWYQDDLIRTNLYRKETCWHFYTRRFETFELAEVFQELMHVLHGKVEILAKYVKENNLNVKIEPVITVSNSMPAIIISKEMQEFLLLLGATMEFDMYFA